MIQLPIEIFPIIFKNVEFVDLIKLREVCRLFRNIIDDKDYNLVDQLCVNVSSLNLSSEDEFFFNSLLDGKRLIKNKIDLNKFNLSNEKLFITKLATSEILKFNLKHLVIFFDNEYQSILILKNLCHFIRLEVLEIDIEINGYRAHDPRLKIIHLNLRKLSIQNYYPISECFEINCPQLTTFYNDSIMDYYDIVYPERIKSLRINNTNYTGPISIDTDQFINIEYLYIVIEIFFGLELKIFKKIKELKLILDFKCAREWFDRDSYEDLKSELFDLLEQKIELNKTRENEIKLFLNDDELKNEEQIKMCLCYGLEDNFSSSSSNSSSDGSSDGSSDNLSFE